MRVRRDRQEIDPGGPQQRTMLALLMARAGEPVSLAEVVDTMWGQEPPDSAVNAVHRNVGMLRRALEPQLAARSPGQWLIRSGGGYRLDVDADTLDLLRFRHLVRQARAATADGQATERMRLFTEALELWQGNGPGGIDPRVRHHPTFTAIDREYLATAREAGDLARTAVASDRLLAAVRQAAEQAPYDEPLQARLLLALATAGHQADALEIYQKIRGRLAEELGLDPGPELTSAHEAVLRQTAHVGKPRTQSGHNQPATNPPATAERPTAQIATNPPPTQLPADLPTFTGRRAELAQALALRTDATSPGTVVISAIGGMAGIGKTTFAVHWAHQVAHRFPDGQLYVNLRGFEPSGQAMSPGEALQHLVSALGVPRQEIPTGLDTQAALYRSRIAGRRMLVLLDNARDADQVRPLLPGSPGCLVIVTSRNDLAGLVATSGAHPLPLGMLSRAEAHDFLTRRIGASRVAAEPDAVDEIIALCAGLPLALAIVTARVATHPGFALAAVAAELRETYGTLDAFVGTEAVTNVRSVFSWSYQALSPDAARLFRLLGPHPGPDVTVPAAASLTGLPVRHVRPLLAELTRAHLLTEQVPGRYTCHDLLRVYATELTEDDDARRSALHRTLDHYLHTAHRGDALLSPNRDPITLSDAQDGVVPEPLADLPHAFAWFAAEEPVILAAVEQAAAHGFDRHAWQLAWAANSYLQRRASPDSMLRLQTTATRAALRDGDVAAYARNLNGLAIACAQSGQLDQAYEHLLEALALFVELGDVRGESRTRQNLTHTVVRQGKPQEALHHAQKALALCESTGDRMGQARALGAMGWALTRLGEHRQALRYCEQARPVLAEFGDAPGEAAAAHSTGHAHHHLGEYPEAMDHYQQAIALSRGSGDHNYEAMVLHHLGDTQQAAGDPTAARASWELALTTIRNPDHPTAKSVRAKLDDMRHPEGSSSAT
ncbi:BTAD domain-containing putative transcriptional regulator [Micromonospora sp. NPDC049523]|uniref:AfsR/SARP family transcriptional regulator n=1 Tax=Micromonospora sp. NPDC049523 TaxID=3155921 RepID=UPI0034150DA1